MGEQAGDHAGSWDEGALEFEGLSRVRLDALLQELLGRVHGIMDSQERLRALLDAVVGIGADLDLNSTLDRIVTAACDLVGARYGALGVVGPDGKRLVRFITHGVTAEQIAEIGPYPEGHGILGLLIDHPTPLRLTNLAEHPRSFGFPANHPPMRSFLGVPIRTRDHAFGNLYLTEKSEGADFTEEDERTVTALAVAAGVVIDNARLYADTERRRRWHEVTAEITQLMLSDFDPQQALQLIATRAREVSGSILGAVLLLDGSELVIEAIDGPPAFTQYIGRRIRADRPILKDVLNGDEQVVFENLAQLAKETGQFSEVPELEELGRTILAPLPAGPRSTGGILMVAAAQGPFSGLRRGPTWSGCSPTRRPWHWTGRRPRRTNPCWRCWRIATGSPGICTTSSSSGSSPPACNCRASTGWSNRRSRSGSAGRSRTSTPPSAICARRSSSCTTSQTRSPSGRTSRLWSRSTPQLSDSGPS